MRHMTLPSWSLRFWNCSLPMTSFSSYSGCCQDQMLDIFITNKDNMSNDLNSMQLSSAITQISRCFKPLEPSILPAFLRTLHTWCITLLHCLNFMVGHYNHFHMSVLESFASLPHYYIYLTKTAILPKSISLYNYNTCLYSHNWMWLEKFTGTLIDFIWNVWSQKSGGTINTARKSYCASLVQAQGPVLGSKTWKLKSHCGSSLIPLKILPPSPTSSGSSYMLAQAISFRISWFFVHFISHPIFLNILFSLHQVYPKSDHFSLLLSSWLSQHHLSPILLQLPANKYPYLYLFFGFLKKGHLCASILFYISIHCPFL